MSQPRQDSNIGHRSFDPGRLPLRQAPFIAVMIMIVVIALVINNVVIAVII